MNRIVEPRALALLCVFLVGCSATQPSVEIQDPWSGRFPMIELANDQVAILVMSPDEQSGLNRASRFDRAGMVAFAQTIRGHTYFGPMVDPEKHDSSFHDHVAGTAGEFGMTESPLGYDQAEPGEVFVKIGVGVLRRVDDKAYRFGRAYPLVNPGDWRIDSAGDRVTMTQTLDGPRGWAYDYRTQVSLLENEPGFVVKRTLTNTGKQVITTDYYNHNFILLDGQPVSPVYRLTLRPDHRVSKGRDVPPWVRFTGRALQLTDALPAGRTLWLPLRYEQTRGDAWGATVELEGGPKIVIDQDARPDLVVIFVKSPYISIEPFIEINLQPGDSFTWRARYLLK